MSRLIFIVFFATLSNFVAAQKQTPQIEINPYVRFDSYPEFSYILDGRPSIDHVKIKGISFWTKSCLYYSDKKSILLKSGIGYYKYSFNNIKKENTQFGKSDARNINFLAHCLFHFYR